MKRMGWGLLFLGLGLVGRAQTFAEWFEQNSTRLKYDAKQIAALQVYIGQAEKGYQLVESGLGTVREMKKGEFELHQGYYTSLGQVNPAIGKAAEVTEIITLQAAIIERFTAALARYRQEQALGADQVTYIGDVFATVLVAGLADVEGLTNVLTANTWILSDDQRLGYVHELDASMRERYAFTLAFTDQTDVLAGQQRAAAADLGMVKGLYGIP